MTGFLVPNGDVDALAARLADVATGRAFGADGVPAEAIARARQRFDTTAHVAEMRELLATAAGRGR